MPRPLNWIRGEGTTKNQRGLGTDTENRVTLQYPPAQDLISYPDSVVQNQYANWINGGSAPIDPTGGVYTLQTSQAPGNPGNTKSIGIGMMIALGLGVALLLRR